MSYDLHSNSFIDPLSILNGKPSLRVAPESVRDTFAVDQAIDTALRSVPLPDGLMTRLGKLAFTVTDETADQVDWLGC